MNHELSQSLEGITERARLMEIALLDSSSAAAGAKEAADNFRESLEEAVAEIHRLNDAYDHWSDINHRKNQQIEQQVGVINELQESLDLAWKKEAINKLELDPWYGWTCFALGCLVGTFVGTVVVSLLFMG